ncbi:polysaccharide deacetylase family protein [Kribbella sp. NPDC051770]|uniref:polysaccharide deacetylase family protein n=1 Tax=Kribbella sp. NPDC051770 TaxID=3155413 RepID=UPI0034282D2D
MPVPPPGKLLLAAAVLLGAALAQAAQPSDHPATVAAPPLRTVAAHGPLAVQLPTAEPGGKKAGVKKPPMPRTDQRTGVTPPRPWSLPGGKVLYLTFDDGPQPVYTPKVLAVLAKHHAQATFFVLGREAAAHPALVETTRRAGHRIGNHTWDHPMLTKLSPARLRQEISTGVRSKCFRPPFRDTNAHVAAVASSYGQHQVLWDVDTRDWEKPGVARIERALIRGARPGAIFLMHDGGGNRSQTVAALDQALTKLAEQGYAFRSLPC